MVEGGMSRVVALATFDSGDTLPASSLAVSAKK